MMLPFAYLSLSSDLLENHMHLSNHIVLVCQVPSECEYHYKTFSPTGHPFGDGINKAGSYGPVLVMLAVG